MSTEKVIDRELTLDCGCVLTLATAHLLMCESHQEEVSVMRAKLARLIEARAVAKALRDEQASVDRVLEGS